MNTKHPFSQSNWVRCVRPALTAALLTCMLFVSGSKPFAIASTQTNIIGPTGSGEFGQVTVLPNGNFVVVDKGYDAPGPILDVGAVYLYNGATGALISKLTGSTTGDFTDSYVLKLLTGNYLVISSQWDNGAAADAGAVTWGNSAAGMSGVVSAANSLVGTTADDGVGWGDVLSLGNRNYVMVSPLWDNGALVDAGAVTWMNGVTGVIGEVSAANSLIGSSAGDKVGFTAGEFIGVPCVTALSNGNYVVASSSWDNGAVADAGAVTWGNGMTGVNGVISAATAWSVPQKVMFSALPLTICKVNVA